MVGALAALAVLADIGSREVSPGANDNGTGVVAMLAIAKALTRAPAENLRVVLLSTSEEATCDGMQAWLRRSSPAFPGIERSSSASRRSARRISWCCAARGW